MKREYTDLSTIEYNETRAISRVHILIELIMYASFVLVLCYARGCGTNTQRTAPRARFPGW